MSDDVRSREDELIRESYQIAHESARLIGASVHLEVSQDVADYVRSFCTEEAEDTNTRTFWGYPVVIKTGGTWDDGFRIDVITRKVIV